MSAKGKINSSENEMCVVCFKNVNIYSIGICDHPVCFECSTRMRVLCRQNECPICRQDMPKVIFCENVQPFRNLKAQQLNSQLVDRKFGIWFQTANIQRAYYRLLEHNCSKCNHEPFRNFNHLKDHMRREHELHYCDLCVANLRIFTWERRCYTRSELAQHRRKGDTDDTSHRGHPLCEFCDTRYMDSDELFRHLRRDHLFCHFCDADGLHQYYPSYEYLRQHFQTEHYLCEEGDCVNEKFTCVFRTDIDLKAHRASVHGKHLGKAASKQARTLELEFTLAPRPRPEQPPNRNSKKPQSIAANNQNERVQEEGAVGYEPYYTEPGGSRGITLTAQDFPSLGGAVSTSVGPPVRTPGGNVTIRHITRGQKALERTDENFPALASDASTVRFSVNSTVCPQDRLQSTTTTSAPNVSIHVNHRPNGAITTQITQNASNSVRVRPRTDAFPALGQVTVPEAQWVKQNIVPKEPKTKVSKVAPAPVLPSRDSPTDFPSLSNSSGSSAREPKPKKSSSVTVPVSSCWFEADAREPKDSKDSKSNKNKKKKVTKATGSNNSSGNESSSSNQKTSSASDRISAALKPRKEDKREERTHKPEEDRSRKEDDKFKKDDSRSRREEKKQNGVVKKRSELRIDSLQISPGTSNGYEDFPSLTCNKPPPGFSVQPPPGFAANDLTFTNSSGQSYSILPSHQFSPPPNFSQRNKKLVESFMASLDSNDAILEFKNLSAMFRNGAVSADQYYQHCKQVMKNDFPKIFPELLVLLPDIGKQQELFRIHCKDAGNKRGLEVCATCRQVMSSSDLRSHIGTHTLQNHFPALGAQELPSVWKK